MKGGLTTNQLRAVSEQEAEHKRQIAEAKYWEKYEREKNSYYQQLEEDYQKRQRAEYLAS